MDDDWETAAEQELVVRQKIANLNKWEGEDDDEDVKQMDGKRHASEQPKHTTKKARTLLDIKAKLEILDRLANGETTLGIARSLGISNPTVRLIRTNEDKIRKGIVGRVKKPVHIVKSKQVLVQEMEVLLFAWTQDMCKKNIPLTIEDIQAKAVGLFNEVKGEIDAPEFFASFGWYRHFKERYLLHPIEVTKEGENVNKDTSVFVKLKDIIKAGGYSPNQVFNFNETGLYWKRLPGESFLSKGENATHANERLTLLLGGNAYGDFKMKPLVVYNCDNPIPLQNIPRITLPVIWRANEKAQMTASLFTEWFKTEFCPAVKQYCVKNNLPQKILLILGKAPHHPYSLDKIDEDIKVIFLPSNTTSLLEPMDQGAKVVFKAFYIYRVLKQIAEAMGSSFANAEKEMIIQKAWLNYDIYKGIGNIRDAWNDVTTSQLNRMWRNVWPACIRDEDKEGDQGNNEGPIVTEILNLSKDIGFNEISEEQITELINLKEEPLTDEQQSLYIHLEKPKTTCPEKKKGQHIYKDLINPKKLETVQKTLPTTSKPSTSRAVTATVAIAPIADKGHQKPV